MKPVRMEAGRDILVPGKPCIFYIVESGTCAIIENGRVEYNLYCSFIVYLILAAATAQGSNYRSKWKDVKDNSI